MICRNCGVALPDDSEYCVVCGTPVNPMVASQDPAEEWADDFRSGSFHTTEPNVPTEKMPGSREGKRGGPIIAIAAAIVTVAVLIVIGLVVSMVAPKSSPDSSSTGSGVDVSKETKQWFGFTTGEGSDVRLSGLSGIEGEYVDTRDGATDKHGYYTYFKLSDMKLDESGLKATGKLEMRWEPQTTRSVVGGEAKFDSIVVVTFSPADMKTLNCTVGKDGESLYAQAQITEGKFAWVSKSGYMKPGYTDNSNGKEDLTVTLTKQEK